MKKTKPVAATKSSPSKKIQTKVLLSELEHAVVSAAARAVGCSIAAFIKDAALGRAKSMRQEVVEKAKKEAASLVAMIDSL